MHEAENHSAHGHERPDTAHNESNSSADLILLAYIFEGMALLGEGASPSRIEDAGRATSWSEGPLEAADRISLAFADAALHRKLASEDHAHGHSHAHGPEHEGDHGSAADHHGHHHHSHCSHSSHEHSPELSSEWMPDSAVYVLEKMAHGFQRLGREDGSGFYDYIDGEASLWSGLSVFARGARGLPDSDIEDRLAFARVLATLELMSEPSLPEKREDARPHRREFSTALEFVRQRGTEAFRRRCDELSRTYGSRFSAPAALHDLVSDGNTE